MVGRFLDRGDSLGGPPRTFDTLKYRRVREKRVGELTTAGTVQGRLDPGVLAGGVPGRHAEPNARALTQRMHDRKVNAINLAPHRSPLHHGGQTSLCTKKL